MEIFVKHVRSPFPPSLTMKRLNYGTVIVTAGVVTLILLMLYMELLPQEYFVPIMKLRGTNRVSPINGSTNKSPAPDASSAVLSVIRDPEDNRKENISRSPVQDPSSANLSNYNDLGDTRYGPAKYEIRKNDKRKLDSESLSKSLLMRCAPDLYSESWVNGKILKGIKDMKEKIRSDEFAKKELCGANTDPSLLQTLGETVQKRLHKLQNPADCKRAKKVVITLPKSGHGLGSYLHHYVVEGLILAIGLNRTLILKTPTGTAYGPGAWEKFMMPLSETCVSAPPPSRSTHGELTKDHLSAQVLEFKFGFVNPLHEYSPPMIPQDIYEAMDGNHCDIISWWLGQLLKYAFRLKPQVQDTIANISSKMGFEPPIVGVHVRRTDKLIRDCIRHDVDEYMLYAEAYFKRLEDRGMSVSRKIYLATDDVSVISKFKKMYPQYKVLCDKDIAIYAEKPKSIRSFRGIVLDLFYLSNADFLVCTLSSNVCRAAYEILLTRNPTGWNSVRSLDCQNSFNKLRQIPKMATQDHTPEKDNEISFKKGSLIQPYSDLLNGYSIGRNMDEKNAKVGLYPTYKVVDVVVPTQMLGPE